MDILIPDNWLRDFLKTKATPAQIETNLSLCGPSVERILEDGKNKTYAIEVTSNRVDTASVYGIAREAAAILPQFGIKASLAPYQNKRHKFTFRASVDYLHAEVDHTLCPRFSVALIRNVKIASSPQYIKDRLQQVGERPINNIVDISNYLMHETGQPVHTFDYDKIENQKMFLRKSKKGEKIVTLDGSSFELPGGDIVIADGSSKLIDLAGIMGGKNSAINENTKNVLLFVQTYQPNAVRRTSMALSHRTTAATLFEKGLDAEQVEVTLLKALEMFEKLTQGMVEKEILDLYPVPYKPHTVTVSRSFLESKLGITFEKKSISEILDSLGFRTSWKNEVLSVMVPSFRARDIIIPEDIVEEVARIYGYFRLPSTLPTGSIPDPLPNSPFDFETRVKWLLKALGAIEVYTSSLTAEKIDLGNPLKLINPLGKDTEVLRTSLLPSLILVVQNNKAYQKPYHVFEMANVYLPQRADTPKEQHTLAGIFSDIAYREAKGTIETLFSELGITFSFRVKKDPQYKYHRKLQILCKGRYLGQMGVIPNGNVYYEIDMQSIQKGSQNKKYKSIPQYPPQIEDITFVLPDETQTGAVLETLQASDSFISEVELSDIYKNAYTFRVAYQHERRTLTDAEVADIRKKAIQKVIKKHKAKVK